MSQLIEESLWTEFELELDKKIELQNLKIHFPENIDHKAFWEKFLTIELPTGSINKTLEKNFAIYILKNNLNLNEIKTKYISQGWKVGGLLGWIKKVQAGEIVEYNPIEIMNWINQYKKELLPLINSTDQTREDFQLIWEKDLKSLPESSQEWFIEKLIAPKSVGVLTGKRGTFKTFFALNFGICASVGEPVLDKFPTKKLKVLYLDKENGTSIIQERVSMLKKGLGLDQDLDIAFICFSQLRLDNNEDIRILEKIIVDNKINFLIVDTYRRAIGFDENSATDVSYLFVNVLRPLVDKHDLSILLIHHDKKSSSGDEMDDIRGSSDLANYCDFILKNERKGKKIIFKQLKCRNAPEIDPLSLSFETDDKTFFKFKCDGNFEPVTAEDKAVEMLIIWIAEKRLKSFKTSEAQTFCFSKGVKRANFFEAIKTLVERGIIQPNIKGVYDVI